MDLQTLSRRDLRRLAGEMWKDPRCEPIAAEVLAAAEAARATSIDRTLITAYLRYYPTGTAAFELFRAAAERVANRHDWPWRQRGKDWHLWDAEKGPHALATAFLTTEDAASILQDAGLDGDLAHGAFAGIAFEAACLQAGKARGKQAQAHGTRLMELFSQLDVGSVNGLLAWALLAPWQATDPDQDYRKALMKMLLERVSDPRLSPGAWEKRGADLKARHGLDLGPLTSLLRRWLNESTVRTFFSIVRNTTDRVDQWDAREAFWLGYLDQGVVDDAWFALGRRAEQQAGPLARLEGMDFGKVSGGGDPGHSALIMTIGELRIAEWSHNGSCRFWPDHTEATAGFRPSRMSAPEPYRRNYDGNHLRTTIGPKNFEYLGHMSGWQWKFAKVIHRHTNVRHPEYGP